MPITVQEKFGRRLSDDAAERVYLIRGTEDAQAARNALLSNSPDTFDNLQRGDTEVEEIEDVVGGAYIGTVTYAPEDAAPEAGQAPRFEFRTRGETKHISQSITTIQSYASPGEFLGNLPPDFNGAINVNSDGEVEGTDITVPVYTFSETHYFDTISTAYKSTIFSLTGRVNNAAFKGLDAGEGLFLGAAGTKRGNEPWEINFAFAGSPNRSDLEVGDITNIVKAGWQFLWVRYAEKEDADAKMMVKRPIAAYVEKVYEEGDFSLLGIGT